MSKQKQIATGIEVKRYDVETSPYVVVEYIPGGEVGKGGPILAGVINAYGYDNVDDADRAARSLRDSTPGASVSVRMFLGDEICSELDPY